MRPSSSDVPCLLAVAALAGSAAAAELTVLRSFNPTVGRNPRGGVILASDGNFYGTTEAGTPGGNSTVFRYAPATNTLTRVATFDPAAGAGNGPRSPLIADADGTLLGTASQQGSVFRFNPATGALTPLVAAAYFHPQGRLALDDAGNVYGSDYGAGAGPGRVFRIDAATGAIATVAPVGDVRGSRWGLTRDAAGNLYGLNDSTPPLGNTLFKVAAGASVAEALAVFDGVGEGVAPAGELLLVPDGFLYGVTRGGGAHGDGTIYRFDPATGALATLASFDDAVTGGNPEVGLTRDAAGNLYGVAQDGGANDGGTVFRLDAATGGLAVLASFEGGSVNGEPSSPLTADAQGNLYGTTFLGGSPGGLSGTIYRVTDAGFVVPEPAALGALAGFVVLARRRGARTVLRTTSTQD